MRLSSTKERTIGKSSEKRRYDLPLNRDSGTGFLLLLIALMSFLTIMALSASFALSAMTDRWSSGLENRLTIEVPATDIQGDTLNRAKIKDITSRIKDQIATHPAVANLHVLSDEEITDLIEPWLGENLLDQNIPIPGLISVTITSASEDTLRNLKDRITKIAPHARLDTHESWLEDLLRLTGALQFAAFIMVLLIVATMITAIAGGIRSRMAVHKSEVELLHLMGAADRYIAGQFQRHSLFIAIKGGAIGLAGSIAALAVIGWVAGEMDVSLLPDFTLTVHQMGILMLLPLLAGILAYVTAGRTVSKVLETLP